MNVTYTCRGLELTNQIKTFSEDKLKKIESLDELIDVNLTIDHARHLFKAELLVHNRSARFNAVEQTPDVFKSINAVIDKIQKQLKRHKEKLIGRKRKAPARLPQRVTENLGERGDMPKLMRVRRQDVRPMSQEEALNQLSNKKEVFLIYRDTNSNTIHVLFKRKDGNYGLIDSDL